MRATGEVVNGDPLVVIKIGFVIGGSGCYWISPGQAVIVGTGDSSLLSAKLRERISQASIVDGDATGEAELPIGAESGTVVKAGVTARDAANGVESW